MAVARITAPRDWHLLAAEATRDDRRLRRELERAAERLGLTAELGADEVRLLAERMPADERALRALREVEDCEAREAARPRARDIALGKARSTR